LKTKQSVIPHVNYVITTGSFIPRSELSTVYNASTMGLQ